MSPAKARVEARRVNDELARRPEGDARHLSERLANQGYVGGVTMYCLSQILGERMRDVHVY